MSKPSGNSSTPAPAADPRRWHHFSERPPTPWPETMIATDGGYPERSSPLSPRLDTHPVHTAGARLTPANTGYLRSADSETLPATAGQRGILDKPPRWQNEPRTRSGPAGNLPFA